MTNMTNPKSTEDIAADLDRLDRAESRLLAIAIFSLLLIVSAVAALSHEIQMGRLDVLQRLQLDVGVRCLFGFVLLFALFAIYQKINMKNLRRAVMGAVAQQASS